MSDTDDKLLQINRIRYSHGNEEYMLKLENRDLGAKFMEYLRSQDTPVVVELKVDVFPATELGVYYENVRTRLQVKKVKTMDVPFYASPLSEFEKNENKEEYWYTNPVARRILIWGVFIVGLFLGMLVR